ncbi:MAG TPA: hypothetical protein VJB13_01025 [Candidatus Nanoarchaeia archaeon]|nr:hypothetical protein [Candidatus Nanoarchaeia archaeon]
MSAKIHLIGTVHGDPSGAERLQKALVYEQPEVLTVEFSLESLQYLENEGFSLLQQKVDSLSFPKDVNDFLKEKLTCLSFEVKVSSAYALEQNIPIHYVDHPSQLELEKQNISAVCNSPKQDFEDFLKCLSLRARNSGEDKIYSLYQSFFDHPGSQAEKTHLEKEAHFYGYRDSFMAQRIQDVAEAIQRDSKIVHVGGLGHCLKDDMELRTLFSRLRHYAPTRTGLKWYEDK